MATGAPIHYVSSGGFLPAPTATREDLLEHARRPHQVRHKTTGLNWDALTPTCPACQQKSGQIDATGLCPTCRPAAEDPPCLSPSDDASTASSPTSATAPIASTTDTTPTPEPSQPPSKPAPKTSTPSSSSTPAPPGGVDLAADLATLIAHVADTRLRLDDIEQALWRLHALLPTHAPAAPTTAPTDAADKAARLRRRPDPAPRRAATPTPARKRASTFPTTQALQLLADGRTVPEIAEHLGCAVSTARRHLQRAGATIPDGRATRSGGRNRVTITDPDLIQRVVELYTSGLSTTDTGRRTGLERRMVIRVLDQAGIPIRPPANVGKPITDTDRALILDRYVAGDSLHAIARHLGIKTTRVRAVLTDAGIPLAPKGGVRNRHHHGDGVRAWAITQGLIPPTKTHGRLPAAVHDAYAAAHNTEGAPAA